MKNEIMMASLLTLTAGVGSQAVYPNYAYAGSKKFSENRLAKEVLMKITAPARYKDQDGTLHDGHVYLKITQKAATPDFPNQLHAEMQGEFYFESDIEDRHFMVNGEARAYKTFQPLYGEDGAVLFDKINADKENGNTYQVYGCSSTTVCEAAEVAVAIKGSAVTLNGELPSDAGVELQLSPYDSETKKNVLVWTKEFSDLETAQIPMGKN